MDEQQLTALKPELNQFGEQFLPLFGGEGNQAHARRLIELQERLNMSEQSSSDFEFDKVASSHTSDNLLLEFWEFLRCNKKYWLLPIVAMLLVFGLMVVLSGTAVAPFIYTLF
jgi:hypothetical protein